MLQHPQSKLTAEKGHRDSRKSSVCCPNISQIVWGWSARSCTARNRAWSQGVHFWWPHSLSPCVPVLSPCCHRWVTLPVRAHGRELQHSCGINPEEHEKA